MTRFANLPLIKFTGVDVPIRSPSWSEWALRYGHTLKANMSNFESSLIVITTPCQSPISGFISLGFLIAQLEQNIGSLDSDSYFDFLYELPAGTKIKRRKTTSKRPAKFSIQRSRTRDGGIQMRKVGGRNVKGASRVFLTRGRCLDYVIDDDSEATGNDALNDYVARELITSISDQIPSNQNWRSNLDSIVVAGPVGGNSSPRRQYEKTELVLSDGSRFSIAQTLAIKEWKGTSDHSPHYCRFFNTANRSQDVPQLIRKSNLVIFTSVESYLRFASQFQTQTKVMVVSRDMGDSKFEMLDSALRAHLDRATPNPQCDVDALESPPVGIQVFYFGKIEKREKQW
jgi:hypothetical protein